MKKMCPKCVQNVKKIMSPVPIFPIFLLCVILTACGSKDVSKDISGVARESTENNVTLTANKDLDFKWSNITTAKYRNDENVHHIIAVKYKGGYDAEVILYEKDDTPMQAWTEVLRCDGIVGKNGIDKEKEGDSKAPTGDFSVGKAFGIKLKPKDTKLTYLDIDDNIYCCGDETAYNQLIDITEMPHDCEKNGEHMIDYSPEYNYGFEIGYNPENVFGKGSAIFFHCKGAKSYTGGCIAVDEKNMVKILETIDENARVIINYSD